jgi:hypothetical protein
MSTPLPATSVELTFEGCVQDAGEYGSDDEWMVSRLFFWVRREGAPPANFGEDLIRVAGYRFARIRIEPPVGYTGPMLYAEVRQRVGNDFETGPVEIGRPSGGALDQSAFARAALDYFRSVASDTGRMLRNEDGRPLNGSLRETAHVRLRHNVEVSRRTVRL